MLILNSRFPYFHRLHASVNTTYTFYGIEEAKEAAAGYNLVLAETEKHAQGVLQVIQDINAEVEKLEKRTPHDTLEEAGIE